MNIQVDHLTFGYEQHRSVLNGISFTVADGKVLGVLGSSGCGKSTLLRIICGIISKESNNQLQGDVRFDKGMDLTELRSNGGIGLMFQEPSLLPNLTVEQNIKFPLEIIGKPNQADVEELIEAVGLSAFRSYLPKHLSGGMQTRTALARTFVTKPALLLLDEPFSALDYGWRIDLYEKLTKMIDSIKSTVVLVSHDISEVLLLSDKVVLLSKTGTIARVLEMTAGKPKSYKPELLASYFDEVRSDIVLLQNHFLEEESLTP